MHNTNHNDAHNLPSKEHLIRSTKRAFFIALAILIFIVLPAEYGVDPTYFGRLVGLTEMGKIKVSLQKDIEAQKERMIEAEEVKEITEEDLAYEGVSDDTELPNESATGTQNVTGGDTQNQNQTEKTDTLVIIIAPDQGTEIKLDMKQGQSVSYERKVDVGYLNYDSHGESDGGESIAYGEGRQEESDSGEITAPFDGKHGWFFRNRYGSNVTITIKVTGKYQDFKQLF